MYEASIFIATFSLLISFITLFLTQFRPPKLGYIVGSTIGVNYREDGFSMYVPITFTNTAHRPGLVNRCSILFARAEASATSHYIEWTEFRKHNAERSTYGREEFAGPIQIEGRSAISKLVWFHWQEGGDFEFLQGRYVFEIILWAENKDRPLLRQKHEFFLGAAETQKLKSYKDTNKSTIKWVSIDKQIEPNKLLTPHEVNKLIGKE